MSSQALNKRLNAVKYRIPESVKSEEEEALSYVSLSRYFSTRVSRLHPAQNVNEALLKQNRSQNLK